SAIADAGRLPQVVEDRHRRASPRRVTPQEVEDEALLRQVEVGRRLVEEPERRSLGQRPGDPHALAFTAGEAKKGPVGQFQGPRLVEAFLGDATVLRAVEAHGAQMRAPPHQGHLPGGEGEVRRDLLREEGDPPRDLAALEARQVESLEEDATASGKKEAGEDAKERALARAVLADDAEDLPRRHLEVDVAEDHAAVLSLQADPARLEKQLVTADPLRRRLRGRAR